MRDVVISEIRWKLRLLRRRLLHWAEQAGEGVLSNRVLPVLPRDVARREVVRGHVIQPDILPGRAWLAA